jgi:hypothetical protein
MNDSGTWLMFAGVFGPAVAMLVWIYWRQFKIRRELLDHGLTAQAEVLRVFDKFYAPFKGARSVWWVEYRFDAVTEDGLRAPLVAKETIPYAAASLFRAGETIQIRYSSKNPRISRIDDDKYHHWDFRIA